MHHSIDALHSHLKTYDMEVWSILNEWDTCIVFLKELEEALAEELLTNEDEGMAQEKAQYEAKRGVVVQQNVVVEEDEDEGEDEGGSESEEEEEEPVCLFKLSLKVKGKCPAK